ncbi:MAG: hypothetical protein KAS84_03570 [Anaerolineales bacterium]|nr:hypothetical protein [Anaerolineales bacterium]
MTKQKRAQVRVLGLVSLSLIIAATTYGFAEANTIHTAGILGAGYGVKSSYEVTKISYILDLSDPSKFKAVDFVIDQQGTEIIAGVSATEKGQIAWATDCVKSDALWNCTFAESLDVLAADWLHVTSVQ